MKFSAKNKIAILLLLGIGISGFVLGFISPRITLFNSEAAGWGKPQANVANKQVQLGIYDVLFVEYITHEDAGTDLVPWTDADEDVNRFTLKLLLNISNPFEDTGLIIPRIDVKLGNLEKPVGRLWTTEEFQLDPFDIIKFACESEALGLTEAECDTFAEEWAAMNEVERNIFRELLRNETNSAGLWTIYLSLFTGEDSGINFFINDLFAGNLGTIFFDATLELGNYPISVEGIFGELLKLLNLGLGGTETGAITDEPIPEMLANALGANLDAILPAVRSDSIFLKEVEYKNLITDEIDNDIRALTENTNVSLFTNSISVGTFGVENASIISEAIYFGNKAQFQTLYLPNATAFWDNATHQAMIDNGTASGPVQQLTNDVVGNSAIGDGVYIWEYYNGTEWKNLPKIDDTIHDFSYTGVNTVWWNSSYISWFDLSDWAPTKVFDRFTSDYYFIRVRNGSTWDSGINATAYKSVKCDIKHARIGNADIPMSPPAPEENTVFGGGYSLDENVILAEEVIPIIYPGINPDDLPSKADGLVGIMQYGTGEFDEYLEDVLGVNLIELVMGEIVQPEEGGVVEGLVNYAKEEDLMFFDSDIFGVGELALDDAGKIFFNIFTALYTHNISTADFLISSKLDFGNLIDTVANTIVVQAPLEFTHEGMWGGASSKWEDSGFSDDDTIYSWEAQESYETAEKYSYYVFGVLAGAAILSIPYNMYKKQDQSKFLSGKDIANAKDLMEDTTGKTILIGSVSSMDNEKMRWELLGGFAAIGLGMVLYLIKDLAFPDFNDAIIYNFLPEIFQSIFENSRNLDSNPYSPLVIFLTAFIDFPGIFAWFIPAFYVSMKRNKQFSNIKKRRVGWDVFWKGAYMIELSLAIMSIGLGIGTLMGNQTLIAYFAGGMIFIIFLFITPYFYFAIGIAGLGGFLGSRIGLKQPGESEVTFTEEYLAEGDDYGGSSDYDEYAEYEEDEYEEYEDTDRTEIVDFDSQGEVVGMVCKYCWETYPVGTDSCGKCGNTDVTQAIECANCGNMIPIDAKFCNECGSQM